MRHSVHVVRGKYLNHARRGTVGKGMDGVVGSLPGDARPISMSNKAQIYTIEDINIS